MLAAGRRRLPGRVPQPAGRPVPARRRAGAGLGRHPRRSCGVQASAAGSTPVPPSPRSSARSAPSAHLRSWAPAAGRPLHGVADPGRRRGVRVPHRRADATCCSATPTPSARSTPGCSAGSPPPAGTRCAGAAVRACRVVVLLPTAASSTCSPSATTRPPAWACTPARVRLIVLVAASLGTAAAVSVSGLIGFVGIIVPHTVRLLAGVQLPGRSCRCRCSSAAAFLALADLVARTAAGPGRDPDRRGHRVLRRAVLRPGAAHQPTGGAVTRRAVAVDVSASQLGRGAASCTAST